MRTPTSDTLKLGVTAVLLGSASLLSWAGLAASVVSGGFARPGQGLPPGAYWAELGFMTFGVSLVTAIAGLMVWVLLEDPQRPRIDAGNA